MLVRSLFKQRYWWLLHDKEEMDKVNFMWSQFRKGDIMKQLKCKLINPKDPSPQKKKVPNDELVKSDLFPIKVYNKLEDGWHLSNKKALFLNMRSYYEAVSKNPFSALPITFHIKSGLEDPEFGKF